MRKALLTLECNMSWESAAKTRADLLVLIQKYGDTPAQEPVSGYDDIYGVGKGVVLSADVFVDAFSLDEISGPDVQE